LKAKAGNRNAAGGEDQPSIRCQAGLADEMAVPSQVICIGPMLNSGRGSGRRGSGRRVQPE
jgi:hypothetical protein